MLPGKICQAASQNLRSRIKERKRESKKESTETRVSARERAGARAVKGCKSADNPSGGLAASSRVGLPTDKGA